MNSSKKNTGEINPELDEAIIKICTQNVSSLKEVETTLQEVNEGIAKLIQSEETSWDTKKQVVKLHMALKDALFSLRHMKALDENRILTHQITDIGLRDSMTDEQIKSVRGGMLGVFRDL